MSQFFLRRLCASLCLLTAVASAAPAESGGASGPAVEQLVLRPEGAFWFDGLDFTLVHFTPAWATTPQGQAKREDGYPRQTGGEWETSGLLAVRGVAEPISYSQRMIPVDGHAFRVAYVATHPEGVTTQEFVVQVSLPLEQSAGRAVVVDGKARVLPQVFSARHIISEPELRRRTLTLPSATGTIEISGVFGLLVQDQRAWSQDGGYTVRIRFDVPDNRLVRSGLELDIRHAPWRSEPVSIRAQANRGFHDEIAGDGRGGWTDQGPVNDLSALPSGPLNAAGVAFDILDADGNGGRAALVLGRAGKHGVPQAATVPVGGKPVWKNLYLLHAGAWMPKNTAPAGRLRVRYADGSENTFEVRTGRDIGNWWSPVALPNGAVGWTGENASSPLVGLYVSRFPLEAKPLAEARLEAEGDTLWMVAGVSGSPDELVPFHPTLPFTATEGPEWARFDHQVTIEPGGVFDFSSLTDAPAGKYGPITVTPAGHFEFANRPGERARFWGVNLCFSANYLEPDEAEMLAKRLAASGYNSARLHHFDRDLSAKDKPSHELDPAQLDKLDHLFAALKRHGLYVNIDLFTSRRFDAGQMAALGIDPDYEVAAQFKALMPISDAAFEDWSTYAKNLLTHRNPHTGLIWAEDPALIGICPVNEDPVQVWMDRAPGVRKRYDALFATWWENAANRDKTAGDRAAGFNLFVHERQIASDARMRGFLRSLGAKAPLTGVNFQSTQALTFVREGYDYVDNHQYWDHPTFPGKKWELPNRFSQTSAVKSAAPAPRGLMATRVWGKPYTVTEFNFVRPNRYRAEGGVFMPAYAALQDWDALYNFDYASHRASILKPGTAGTFSIANDPIGLLADRVAALVFRRGDIEAAKGAVGYAVRTPDAFGVQEKDFPPAFSRLGLVTRIGSGTAAPGEQLKRHGLDAVVVGPGASAGDDPRVLPADNTLPRRLAAAGAIPAASVDEAGTRYVSDTGQIELSTDVGALKVVTPRSELFVLPAGRDLQGGRVAVKNGRVFGTVSVVSVDGKPLGESARVLVMHLTDALASGTSFAHRDRTLLESRGGLPYLIESGDAEILLRLDAGKQWTAWVVDATGRRVREAPLVARDGGWVLAASTVSGKDTQVAYELAAVKSAP